MKNNGKHIETSTLIQRYVFQIKILFSHDNLFIVDNIFYAIPIIACFEICARFFLSRNEGVALFLCVLGENFYCCD